jgi:hypothetical protein
MEFDFDCKECGELLQQSSDPMTPLGVVDTGQGVIATEPCMSYTPSPDMIDADIVAIDDTLSGTARHRNTSILGTYSAAA